MTYNGGYAIKTKQTNAFSTGAVEYWDCNLRNKYTRYDA